jgi:hypothetical protein
MIRPATHILQKLIEASKTYITKTTSDVICGPDTRHYGVITIETKYWSDHNNVKNTELVIMDYEARLLAEELTTKLKIIDEVLGRTK